MIANDRCRREVTSDGVVVVVCDMHRDGGPDAVGEKCPYYCDRVDCRRAGKYEVEGGLYCAPCARLTLQQALEEGETIEVEYQTASDFVPDEHPPCCVNCQHAQEKKS